MNAITMKSGAVLLLSAALVPLPSPTRCKVFQLDPKYHNFRVSVQFGRKPRLSKDGILITANYYDYRKPIGVTVDNGKELPWIQIRKPRATLVIQDGKADIKVLSPKQTKDNLRGGKWKNATVIQAGPMLVDDGKVVIRKYGVLERFSPGVFRRTNHVAIGITKSGKLIFLYSRGRNLYEVSYLLKSLGVIKAIHCDSGSSASMICNRRVYGIGNPKTAIVAEPK